jgi:aryl-alcohol dehydrogenase-like predicted oxidoreductase
MDYINLGNTGMQVSRICLGCMAYAAPEKGSHPWALNEEQGRPFIQKALELGINFFDTANVYSSGASEEVLGRALRDFAKRDEIVIATKVYGKMREGPNGSGLSRKAIMHEIDESLRRLGVDYVDLYQTHRWDYKTPLEETLEALHDIVKTGKARYIGASSMFAWQFCQSLYLADLHGWTRFVSMQPHYNLLYREEEREMLALCEAESVGVLPWSPLARGRLTRAWESEPTTERGRTDEFGKELYGATQEADKAVVNRVGELSQAKGLPRAQIALAWVLHKPAVTAPIVGATKPHHLQDAVDALSVKLSDEEIKFLEEPYIPHSVAGFK